MQSACRYISLVTGERRAPAVGGQTAADALSLCRWAKGGWVRFSRCWRAGALPCGQLGGYLDKRAFTGEGSIACLGANDIDNISAANS